MSDVDIPVIDIGSALGYNLDDPNAIPEDVFKTIGEQIVEALVNIGFLYVVNHGMSNELIGGCCENMKSFFKLRDDQKLLHCRDWESTFCGYMPYKNDKVVVEQFDKTRPPDVKEILDFCHNCPTSDQFSRHEELPKNFESTSRQLIVQSQDLNLRLMLLLGYGLGLDDPYTFVKGFSGHNTSANSSQLRVAYYPAMKEGYLQPGQLRCGEHTDYGTFTLLFMDSTPGLQVFNRKGFYQDIEPLSDAVLVNIGDLLQRWSGDKLHAAKHRVIVRPDTLTRPRYSLIYFTSPDDQFPIVPITGDTSSYQPITAGEQLRRRFEDTFVKGKGLDDQLNTVAKKDYY